MEQVPDKAELTGDVTNIACENCAEEYLFALALDGRNFTIGLKDILECVRFGETSGALPPLPAEWWWEVEYRYQTRFG